MAADDGSDMEGWGDDDGWGEFEEKKRGQKPPPPPMSSGADFFDTFQGNFSQSNKPKEKDYFSDFGVMAAPSSLLAKREKSPPPLVSATLFGSTGSGKKSDSGGASDGWGDWGSDSGSTKLQVRKLADERDRIVKMTVLSVNLLIKCHRFVLTVTLSYVLCYCCTVLFSLSYCSASVLFY